MSDQMTRTLEIMNEKGLHARASAKFVMWSRAMTRRQGWKRMGWMPRVTASWGF